MEQWRPSADFQERLGELLAALPDKLEHLEQTRGIEDPKVAVNAVLAEWKGRLPPYSDFAQEAQLAFEREPAAFQAFVRAYEQQIDEKMSRLANLQFADDEKANAVRRSMLARLEAVRGAVRKLLLEFLPRRVVGMQ